MVRKNAPAPESVPPEPAFEITFNRSLSGTGTNVKLSDLRTLVREAQHRGFSEHATVRVQSGYEGQSLIACGPQVITIYDAKEENAHG